jgi:hypothetical protein
LSSGKGKEKVATSGSASKVGSRSPPRDVGAFIEPTASSEKRDLVHSDGSSISEPVSERQQASSKVATEQVHGSDGDGPGAAQAGA